jgi:hypothetical protein
VADSTLGASFVTLFDRMVDVARAWVPRPRERSSRTVDAPPPESAVERPCEWEQHLTHRGLLGSLSTPAATAATGPVDLVVVPTSRKDPEERSGVRTALRLAQDGMARFLLVIVSKDAADPDSVRRLRDLLASVRSDVGVWVTELPPATRVPKFKVDRLPLTSAHRRYAQGDPRSVNEVGTKRNLALLLARCMKLRTVLFVDDDITPRLPGSGGTLDPASLRAALRHLTDPEGPSAVGWELRGYDDNSVVCRAAQLAGRPQEQFIGGGALLVRADPGVPFFPAIYNEDWLFLLGLLDGRPPERAWVCAGDVVQDPYDGYHPRRARSEELGDMLGEGLMSLLHLGRSPEAETDQAFWRAVVDGRRRFIAGVRADLERRRAQGRDDAEVAAALGALDAAMLVHRHLDLKPKLWLDQFVRYQAAWRTDLDDWSQLLARADRIPLEAVFPQPPEAFVRAWKGAVPQLAIA